MSLALVYKDLKAADEARRRPIHHRHHPLPPHHHHPEPPPPPLSHVGLGVTAENTRIKLATAGHDVSTMPVVDGYDLWNKLRADPSITHAVMLAPWVDTQYVERMCRNFPKVQFTMTTHSNVGFLQADRWAMQIIREGLELQKRVPNYKLSSNCLKFCEWVQAAYGFVNAPPLCTPLPNLYHLPATPVQKPCFAGGEPLRIGIFGATRVQKNLMSAAAAALVIANKSGAEQTEIWFSAGREEGGKGVMASITQMVQDVPGVKMVQSGWSAWEEFCVLAGRMHLMLCPSYTESFCNVVADGISAGTPVVVTDVVDWAPASWMAKADEPVDIANVGMRLMASEEEVLNGHVALQAHNEVAMQHWESFLA